MKHKHTVLCVTMKPNKSDERCFINNSLREQRIYTGVMVDFDYLSFPELSSDLHSVEVPAWVGAPVVVSYPDLFYKVTDILQLGTHNTV